MKCFYFCTAAAYNFDVLKKTLKDHQLRYQEFDQVLHIEIVQGEDVFIFAYGCIVFWNVNEEKRLKICDLTNLSAIDKHSVAISDKCKFVHGSQTIVHEEEDLIELESTDSLLKLSLSHGLSQSVKLEVFEKSIIKTISKTRPLTKQIKELGKTSLSRKKLSQLIGELFHERNLMNLDSDLLDTPEFFWKKPAYEAFYHQAAEYMDIKARLDILNRRLDVVHDVYDFLSNELHQSHASSLEWIIILLIVSEVVLTISKDILKLF
ncbi:MAG: hypothetical protein HEEMFOPI_00822 [Holosporales bacterium]